MSRGAQDEPASARGGTLRTWLVVVSAVFVIVAALTAVGILVWQPEPKTPMDKKVAEVLDRARPLGVFQRMVNEVTSCFGEEDVFEEPASVGELYDVFSGMGPEALPALLYALDDRCPRVRTAAVIAVDAIAPYHQSKDTRLVEPLVSALTDEDPWVRFSAARGLGSIGDTRAVGPLIANLSDSDEFARYSAAWALGELGDRRAVAPLIGALTEVDKDVRRVAAKSLGQVGDARAVEPLLARLADADEFTEVQAAAACALGDIGDARAVPALEQAAHEGPAVLKQAAEKALRAIRARAAFDQP